MNIIILGAAGFIGTNLTIYLSKNKKNRLTLVDKNISYFQVVEKLEIPNLNIVQSDLMVDTDFDMLLKGQDIVYHLISTTVPSTSNKQIAQELTENVVLSANLLDSCVRCGIKKIVFLSSGGTVYGNESSCPLNETMPTNPITSYGIQKISIEKLLYLYNYLYDLDYRIIRLSNPYGPYQRPNGVLGAVTTFTFKALKHEEIVVYGDGSVIRDFIYIDDAICGIANIVDGNSKYKTFNLGSGYGTSINDLIDVINGVLGVKAIIKYSETRKVDVLENYLDISRYETEYGELKSISLEDGIRKTAEYLRKTMDI